MIIKFYFISTVLIGFNLLLWFFYTKGNARKSIGLTVATIGSIVIALLLSLFM